MRKQNHRGAMFIEYALVIALVVTISASFVSENIVAKEINSIFNRVTKVMNLAVNEQRELGSIEKFIQALKDDKTPFKIKDTQNTRGVTDYTSIMDFLTCNLYSDCKLDSENPALTRYHTVINDDEQHNLTSMVEKALMQSGYIDSDKFMWGIDEYKGGTRTMWITDIRPSDNWDVKDPILVKTYTIYKDGTIELKNESEEKRVYKKTKVSAATGKNVTYYSFFQ